MKAAGRPSSSSRSEAATATSASIPSPSPTPCASTAATSSSKRRPSVTWAAPDATASAGRGVDRPAISPQRQRSIPGSVEVDPVITCVQRRTTAVSDITLPSCLLPTSSSKTNNKTSGTPLVGRATTLQSPTPSLPSTSHRLLHDRPARYPERQKTSSTSASASSRGGSSHQTDLVLPPLQQQQQYDKHDEPKTTNCKTAGGDWPAACPVRQDTEHAPQVLSRCSIVSAISMSTCASFDQDDDDDEEEEQTNSSPPPDCPCRLPPRQTTVGETNSLVSDLTMEMADQSMLGPNSANSKTPGFAAAAEREERAYANTSDNNNEDDQLGPSMGGIDANMVQTWLISSPRPLEATRTFSAAFHDGFSPKQTSPVATTTFPTRQNHLTISSLAPRRKPQQER